MGWGGGDCFASGFISRKMKVARGGVRPVSFCVYFWGGGQKWNFRRVDEREVVSFVSMV